MSNYTRKWNHYIITELTVKGYTKNFLKVFLIFFKQRFFRSIMKSGSNSILFNKYTLLRSSFVNKSSREQVEKRILKKKIYLVFSEFDFKVFYGNLTALDFKGVSLRLSKHHFSDYWIVLNKIRFQFRPLPKKNINYISKFFLRIFWCDYGLKRRVFFFKFLKKKIKKSFHKVLPVVGIMRKLSQNLRLKFLKMRSLKKNRLRSGFFRVMHKKVSSTFKKSFLPFKSGCISLSYSYSLSNKLELEIPQFSSDFNKRLVFLEKNRSFLLKKKHLLCSILRYRRFLTGSFSGRITPFQVDGSVQFKTDFMDQFNVYLKLFLSLNLGVFERWGGGKPASAVKMHHRTPSFLKKECFYDFLLLIRSLGLNNFIKFLSKKDLSLFFSNPKCFKMKSFFPLFQKKKTSKENFSTNPWVLYGFTLGKNLPKRAIKNRIRFLRGLQFETRSQIYYKFNDSKEVSFLASPRFLHSPSTEVFSQLSWEISQSFYEKKEKLLENFSRSSKKAWVLLPDSKFNKHVLRFRRSRAFTKDGLSNKTYKKEKIFKNVGTTKIRGFHKEIVWGTKLSW